MYRNQLLLREQISYNHTFNKWPHWINIWKQINWTKIHTQQMILKTHIVSLRVIKRGCKKWLDIILNDDLTEISRWRNQQKFYEFYLVSWVWVASEINWVRLWEKKKSHIDEEKLEGADKSDKFTSGILKSPTTRRSESF